MHIITLLAEVITGVPLSGLKAVLEDVAPLLADEAVLGDVVSLLVAEAVLEEGVGGDDFRRQKTEDGGRKKYQ